MKKVYQLRKSSLFVFIVISAIFLYFTIVPEKTEPITIGWCSFFVTLGVVFGWLLTKERRSLVTTTVINQRVWRLFLNNAGNASTAVLFLASCVKGNWSWILYTGIYLIASRWSFFFFWGDRSRRTEILQYIDTKETWSELRKTIPEIIRTALVRDGFVEIDEKKQFIPKQPDVVNAINKCTRSFIQSVEEDQLVLFSNSLNLESRAHEFVANYLIFIYQHVHLRQLKLLKEDRELYGENAEKKYEGVLTQLRDTNLKEQTKFDEYKRKITDPFIVR